MPRFSTDPGMVASHVTALPSNGLVKVHFNISQGQDGWPPVAVESMWAEPLLVMLGLYSLRGVPFFLTGVSNGDTVEGRIEEDNQIWATKVVRRSGHLVVRVGPNPDGHQAKTAAKAVSVFEEVGISSESSGPPFWLVALDIPETSDLAVVKNLLRRGEESGDWEFEEASINQAWVDL